MTKTTLMLALIYKIIGSVILSELHIERST